MILLQLLLFILGLLFLWKGGDYLVDGASGLALRFGISPFIIGLTIVAFGTSAPEMAVNILSSLKGTSDITFGNILGSNLSNLLMILGISSMVYPISVQKSQMKLDVPISIAATLLLCGLIYFGSESLTLTRLEGGVLLFGFLGFLFLVFKSMKNDVPEVSVAPNESRLKLIFFTILGIILLPLGGKLVTEPAILIATQLGISQAYIALFTIAIGTSLPELVTSVNAALKRKTDIAFGNIIGSNIFNILLILGISGVIAPISFNPILFTEIGVIVVFSIIVIFFANNRKPYAITRYEGLTLFLGYISYMIFATLRG